MRGAVLTTLLCGLASGLAPLLAAEAREPGSAAAVHSKAAHASEYWDLAARLESGHRVFVRFSISNEGPGSDTAYAIGQVVFPDGRVVPFTNGRRAGDWDLSSDGLRLEIGSSLLDLHGPVRHFEVDKRRKGIAVHLDFEPPRVSGISWEGAPAGYHVDLLESGGPVRGTLFVRDVTSEPVPVRGTLSATHTWMDVTESDLVLRRLDLHAVASRPETARLYLTEVLAPDGRAHHGIVFESAGAPPRKVDGLSLRFEGAHAASTERYPVPERIRVEGALVEGTIELGALRVDHDPLSVAPQPFRWFLSFAMKPRQVWFDATWRLRWKDAPGDGGAVEGEGSLSLFFLNRMPKQLAAPGS